MSTAVKSKVQNPAFAVDIIVEYCQKRQEKIGEWLKHCSQESLK